MWVESLVVGNLNNAGNTLSKLYNTHSIYQRIAVYDSGALEKRWDK